MILQTINTYVANIHISHIQWLACDLHHEYEELWYVIWKVFVIHITSIAMQSFLLFRHRTKFLINFWEIHVLLTFKTNPVNFVKNKIMSFCHIADLWNISAMNKKWVWLLCISWILGKIVCMAKNCDSYFSSHFKHQIWNGNPWRINMMYKIYCGLVNIPLTEFTISNSHPSIFSQGLSHIFSGTAYPLT